MSKRKGSVDDSYGFNGNGDDGTDSKPSRVLHLRNVPDEIIEAEIVQLGLPFGQMTNMLLIRSKKQALLEMADIASAQAMVNYYASRPITMYNHRIYIQYSRHEHLKTMQTAQNTGAQAALQAAKKLMTDVDKGHAVLHVTIDNMTYPITIDVLQQIFQKFGQVLKINTFTKNGEFQALIQLDNVVAAQSALAALNGQNIYDGCCTLRIELSHVTDLNVMYNNEQSYDYTNPHLPSGPDTYSTSGLPISEFGAGDNGVSGYGGDGNSAYSQHYDGSEHSPALHASNVNEETAPVLEPPINSDELFYCGHKRPVWDEHDMCVRCRTCSYNNPCPTCITWSRDKWRSAEEYWRRQAERERREQMQQQQQQQPSHSEENLGGGGWNDGEVGGLVGVPLLPTPGDGGRRTLLPDIPVGHSHMEQKVALLPSPDDDWQQQGPGGDLYSYPSQQGTSMDWYETEEAGGSGSGDKVSLGQGQGYGAGGSFAESSASLDTMKQILLSTAKVLGPELCSVKSATDANGVLNIAFPPSPAWITEFATVSSLAAAMPSSGSNLTPFLNIDDLKLGHQDLEQLAAFSGLPMRPLIVDEDINDLGRPVPVRLSADELADWEAQLRHSLVIPSVQDFLVAGILSSLNECPPSRETTFIRQVLGLITTNVGKHMQAGCRLLQNIVMARRDAHLAGCNMSEPTRKALRTQSAHGSVLFGGHVSRFVGIERARQASGLGSRPPHRR